MNFVAFHIYSAYRFAGAYIFAMPATYAAFRVDGRYAQRAVLFRPWYPDHGNGSRGAMRRTVSALYRVCSDNAKLGIIYGVTDAYRSFLFRTDSDYGTGRADFAANGAFAAAESLVVVNGRHHEMLAVQPRVQHAAGACLNAKLAGNAQLAELFNGSGTWWNYGCNSLRRYFFDKKSEASVPLLRFQSRRPQRESCRRQESSSAIVLSFIDFILFFLSLFSIFFSVLLVRRSLSVV